MLSKPTAILITLTIIVLIASTIGWFTTNRDNPIDQDSTNNKITPTSQDKSNADAVDVSRWPLSAKQLKKTLNEHKELQEEDDQLRLKLKTIMNSSPEIIEENIIDQELSKRAEAILKHLENTPIQ